MLIHKEIKYVLLFSIFAFIISVILGILSRVSFITILFRAFFQFIIFFLIGLLIEFVYKKYLYDLFRDVSLSDKDSKNSYVKDKNDTATSDAMTFSSRNNPLARNNDDFSLMEEVENYKIDDAKYSKPSDRRSSQISYVAENDPKVVAEAIKALIHKKE
ncbi:hypothetical protein CR532_01390 [Candidatus Borreliella tachyglossi]|uniref:Uncharacterized protein n=1 Tax=Candidatus Borreliella tachyglossi TaxID=1964448 RepID=A0A2S1LWI1_9SPIR|nr:hypothetical protein [Candidatus Borreliella tachyglossi]AWG42659.1 hypothetical protein CR532_01390 [Candidatus Borreliella tachyglossi]